MAAIAPGGHVDVTALTSSIGARVTGLDVRTLDAAGAAEVRRALDEHGVLVFPDQHLTRDEQCAFTALFGDLHDHPVREFLSGGAAGDPVSVVENHPDKPAQDDQHFHVDYSFHRVVPDIAVLRPEVIPPKGGDTMWSSAAAAHDALSPALRSFLGGLVARHDAGPRFWFEMDRTLGAEATKRLQTEFAGNTHPVIGPHPFTGRPVLFVNAGYTVAIEGLTPGESAAVLRFLFDHVNEPAFHYRHKWRAGDLVMWDEHQTTHRGPNDFGNQHRRLTRVTAGQSAPARPRAAAAN